MESIIISKKTPKISDKTKELIKLILCLLCIFLFTYVAYSKLTDHQRFFDGLSKVHFISNYAVFLSWAIPISELIIAILLIVPKTQQLGLVGFIILMVLFTVYITDSLLGGKNLPCSCGGVIEKMSWKQHVWFNLAFIVIAGSALWLSKLKIN